MSRFINQISLFDVFGAFGLLIIATTLMYPILGKADTKVDTVGPIIVDLGSTGQPDILAKAGWWRDTSRKPDMDALRPFKMHEIVQHWEWVGPDVGLLVHNPSQDMELPIAGKDFFGNMTFGGEVEDGYAALSRLDANNSSTLEGDELSAVWVWRDIDSNAIVQFGELQSSKTSGITILMLNPDRSEPGKLNIPNGCVINGKVVGTWDWWPLGITLSMPGSASEGRPSTCTYAWTADGGVARGTFEFRKEGSRHFVLFYPEENLEVIVPVIVSGFKLEWMFGNVIYKAYLHENGTLMGQTDAMLWTAIPVGKSLNL